MKIAKDSSLLMIGDSITDVGRSQPVAEIYPWAPNSMGSGYANVVAGMLGAYAPEARVRVINMGTSGNTVRNLAARWDRDVVAMKPDWLSIMIGINDVWRQFDVPFQKESHVPLDEYGATLDELVRRTLPLVKGIVLMTPYFIEPNREDAMRAAMELYADKVRSIAAARGTLFVDTQAAFDRLLAHCHPAYLAWDRIHPNVIGHTAIARAFLDAVGLDLSTR
jgi:lysophospholipase L1-like esterase